MGSRSLNRRQLSRSKLDLFLECSRCFYEDVALGNGGSMPTRAGRCSERWTISGSAATGA